MGNVEDIKKILKEGKVIIGAKLVMKNLNLGKLDRIYLYYFSHRPLARLARDTECAEN